MRGCSYVDGAVNIVDILVVDIAQGFGQQGRREKPLETFRAVVVVAGVPVPDGSSYHVPLNTGELRQLSESDEKMLELSSSLKREQAQFTAIRPQP